MPSALRHWVLSTARPCCSWCATRRRCNGPGRRRRWVPPVRHSVAKFLPSSYQNAPSTEPCGPIHQISMLLSYRDAAATPAHGGRRAQSGYRIAPPGGVASSYQNAPCTEPSMPIHQRSPCWNAMRDSAGNATSTTTRAQWGHRILVSGASPSRRHTRTRPPPCPARFDPPLLDAVRDAGKGRDPTRRNIGQAGVASCIRPPPWPSSYLERRPLTAGCGRTRTPPSRLWNRETAAMSLAIRTRSRVGYT